MTAFNDVERNGSKGCSPEPPDGRREGVWVGVDIGPTVIRAAVYSAGLDLLDKMKLSTKKERGFEAVLNRVERCVRYAVDDCDLSMDSVLGIGVGISGVVDGSAGVVTCDARFGWRMPVALQAGMVSRFKCEVRVGNEYQLAARAVHFAEVGEAPIDMGVLFPGGQLGAGLIAHGQVRDLSAYPSGNPLLPVDAGGVIATAGDETHREFRARDFRKAIRKGNAQAERFLRESVGKAAQFGARLVRECHVQQLVLAGGAIDENKAEMLAEARRVLAAELGAEIADEIEVRCSELGDLAVLMGAALHVRETVVRGSSGLR